MGLHQAAFIVITKDGLSRKKGFGVCELAQWVKVLAAQAWSPEHNPQTPRKGERKQLVLQRHPLASTWVSRRT